eukprot:9203093-Pyramimonas_sp.AAC.1
MLWRGRADSHHNRCGARSDIIITCASHTRCGLCIVTFDSPPPLRLRHHCGLRLLPEEGMRRRPPPALLRYFRLRSRVLRRRRRRRARRRSGALTGYPGRRPGP